MASVSASDAPPPVHVFFFVHGLRAEPEHWEFYMKVFKADLCPHLPPCLLYPSRINSGTKTFDGVDTCGDRLAQEVASAVAAYPSLKGISFVCHSLGGLIARRAVGRMYDPNTGSIAGLQPRVFVTLATPHQGCTSGPSAAGIPFVRGMCEWEFGGIGQKIENLAKGISTSVSSRLFKRTGLHLFYGDVGGVEPLIPKPSNGNTWQGMTQSDKMDSLSDRPAPPEEPMLVLLTRDVESGPNRGYYFSALASFEHRACYANVIGDHLVAWANASLRGVEELPQELLPGRDSDKNGRVKPPVGVVREDPLSAGEWRRPEHRDQALAWALTRGDVPPGPTPPPAAAPSAPLAGGGGGCCPPRPGPAPEAWVDFVRGRICRIPFRRVDVSFEAAPFPGAKMAHYHIQVKRQVVNGCGAPVAAHVALSIRHVLTRPAPEAFGEASHVAPSAPPSGPVGAAVMVGEAVGEAVSLTD